MKISRKSRKYLLELARKAVLARFSGARVDFGDIPEEVQVRAGTFVTLTTEGELRGCIGTIEPVDEIYAGVAKNAVKAAVEDPRFDPVDRAEFGHVRIEVSILSVPEIVEYNSVEELVGVLEKSRPGVVLDFGARRATFLPQVWDQMEGVEEFMCNLCEKAGLPSEIWRELNTDLKISTYEVIKFGEKG